MPFARIVEDFQRSPHSADGVGDGVDPFLAAEWIIGGVVDLSRNAARPLRDAEHVQGQHAGEHDNAGDATLDCYVLGHGATVGEAGGDEALGKVLDGGDGALHEGRIANALGVGRSLVVVIEDSAVVLVDDVNLVAAAAQTLGSVKNAWADTEDGMEQGDMAHTRTPIVDRTGRCTVYEVQQPRSPGQRAGLTRTGVLAAARGLLDERGLEAFTMRALAERLDVAPNALYSHVTSKTSLIDDVLDDILAEVEVPAADDSDPRAGLHALMSSSYEVLVAHRDLVPFYLARQGARGPHAQRLGQIVLGQLAGAGVSETRAHEALRVLIVYTIGFAAFATRPPIDAPDDAVPPASDELRSNFEEGLRWLLTGITAPT